MFKIIDKVLQAVERTLGRLCKTSSSWDDTMWFFQSRLVCVYVFTSPFRREDRLWLLSSGRTFEQARQEANAEFLREFEAECGNTAQVSAASLLAYARDLQLYIRMAEQTPFDATRGLAEIANQRLPILRQALIQRGIYTLPA